MHYLYFRDKSIEVCQKMISLSSRLSVNDSCVKALQGALNCIIESDKNDKRILQIYSTIAIAVMQSERIPAKHSDIVR